MELEDLWRADAYGHSATTASLRFNEHFDHEKPKQRSDIVAYTSNTTTRVYDLTPPHTLPHASYNNTADGLLTSPTGNLKISTKLGKILSVLVLSFERFIRSPPLPTFLTQNILTQFYSSPVTRAVLKMYKKQFIYSGMLKLVHTCIQFTPSILVSKLLAVSALNHQLLNQVRAATSAATKTTAVGSLLALQQQVSKNRQWGYAYAVMLLLVLCGKTFVENQYFDEVINMSLNVRNTLAAAVYQKSLRLSPAGRQNHTVSVVGCMCALWWNSTKSIDHV